MEHIITTTNESRLGDNVQFSPSIFKIVYTDHLKAHLSLTMIQFYLFVCFIVDISESEKWCIQSNCYQKK